MNPRNHRLLVTALFLAAVGGYLLTCLTGCVTHAPAIVETVQHHGDKQTAMVAAIERTMNTPGSRIIWINGTTGSMARTNGAFWSFAIGVPVSVRDLKVGERVVRMDINAHHAVSRVAGPLVYTKGTSNQYEDPLPISGTVYRVLSVHQYSN